VVHEIQGVAQRDGERKASARAASMASCNPVFEVSRMLKFLKAATHSRHQTLERRLPLIDTNLSHATVRHFVQRLFGFHEPLEAQLLSIP
jgi:hypothetical protein